MTEEIKIGMLWETITNIPKGRPTYYSRSRVPMGWIVECMTDKVHVTPHKVESGYDWQVSIIFVFDPFHLWKLETLSK